MVLRLLPLLSRFIGALSDRILFVPFVKVTVFTCFVSEYSMLNVALLECASLILKCPCHEPCICMQEKSANLVRAQIILRSTGRFQTLIGAYNWFQHYAGNYGFLHPNFRSAEYATWN